MEHTEKIPPPRQKPQSVAIAVKLLWISYAMGLARVLMDFTALTAVASLAYVSFVMIFTFVVAGYLIFRIAAGENWARIAFLVMLIIGLIPTFPQIINEWSTTPLMAMLSIIQLAIQAYAMFLLFTPPGNSWFSKAAST